MVAKEFLAVAIVRPVEIDSEKGDFGPGLCPRKLLWNTISIYVEEDALFSRSEFVCGSFPVVIIIGLPGPRAVPLRATMSRHESAR